MKTQMNYRLVPIRHTKVRGLGLVWAMALAIASFLSTPSTRAELIGYWSFDDGTGLTAADTSGSVNVHDGDLSPTATPAWVPGRFGTALNFDPVDSGSGDLVTVPFHEELRLNGPFTITFWYRPEGNTPGANWPGIIRIGSQSDTSGGWGYFRPIDNQRMRFKRGNAQPDEWFPETTFGAWHYVVIRYDGAGNNTSVINGNVRNFATTWLAGTTTANLEMGRMDQFDDASLDDLAIWNEALSDAQMRSLYTVPTVLTLAYSVEEMRYLWEAHAFGAGSSVTIKGVDWTYTDTLPGSTTPGDAYIANGAMWVVLGATSGMTAPLSFLTGTVSPGGLGVAATLPLFSTPDINADAYFVLDLGATTDEGNGVNDLISIQGDLNLKDNTIFINPLAPLANGTYRLFNYSGAKTGSFNPVIDHDTRYVFTLDEDTPNQINLVVTGAPGNLAWNSPTAGNWDLTSPNWLNTDTTLADTFAQGDAVLFDDSGVYQTNVNLTTGLFPASVAVNSSTLDYTIGGSGQIGGAGAGLTKDGTSTLTLGGNNTFIGSVNVNAGTLKLASNTALGSTNAGTVIADGATLDLNNRTAVREPISASGAGVNGAGALVNNGASSTADAVTDLTLTGDTTLGGTGRWDFTGTMRANGHTLTKVGLNEIWISPQGGDMGWGDVHIMEGTIGVEGVNFNAMGDPTATLTLHPGTALGFWSLNNAADPMNKTVVMNDARWINNNGDNYFSGPVTLNGQETFTMSANLTLGGPVDGVGSLTKVGSGRLTLGGANTYTGNTLVQAGTLALGAGASIDSPQITLAGGTTLDATALPSGLTLDSGQVLAGSGSVAGNLAAAWLIPGGSYAFGTLTLSNDLTLTGGGAVGIDLSSQATEGGGVNDLVNVTGNLNLNGVTTLSVNPLGPINPATNYNVISYGGTLTGDAANLTVTSDSRYSFAVDTATTPGKISVSVSGGAPATLEWSGNAPGSETLWDVQTTANWIDSQPASDVFYTGDAVVFNDNASGFSVDLVGTVAPSSTTVAAAANTYTFGGAGKLSGGPLVKDGAGSLLLVNSGVNDYQGGTTINGGVLQAGDGATSGNLGSGTVALNAGTLILNRSDEQTLNNSLTGTGTLEKAGAGRLTIPAVTAGFDGPIVVSGGTLRTGDNASLGGTTGGTTVGSGATLDVNGRNLGAERFNVAGEGVNGLGAIVNTGGGQNNATRFVTLTGDTTFGGTARWDIRSNPDALLTGNNYNLTKVGANEIWLVNAGGADINDITLNQGLIGIQGTTTMGIPSATLSINEGARLGFYGVNNTAATPMEKVVVMNNGGMVCNNGTTWLAGPVTLTGTNTFDMSATINLTGQVTGEGRLRKLGTGTLALGADSDYTGGTVIDGGTLELGTNGPTGSIPGDVLVNSGTFSINRSDVIALANNVSGAGGMYIRSADGVILDGTATVNITGSIEVGRNELGKLIIEDGAAPIAGRIMLGNVSGTVGLVDQNGGDVTVTIESRVGHWPNETSTYNMNGGTHILTGDPTGVGGNEKPGIFYIGVDGTGILNLNGGLIRAHGVVLDNRGNTAGDDTLNLNGGRLEVGPSGIGSGSGNANASYVINLGAGTLASWGSWTSPLNMNLVSTGDNTVFDTGGHTNILSGALTGVGGLTKTGAGALALQGASTYQGSTVVDEGILAVLGTIGAGLAQVEVQSGGILAGTGLINDAVVVAPGGFLAPGITVGTLTVASDVVLGGTALMEIDKNDEGVINNDRLVTGLFLQLGGALNVTATGAPLTAGDSVTLFQAVAFSGAFESVNLPPLDPGLVWDTSLLNSQGVISVAALTMNFSWSGNTLTLSWPDFVQDYLLQSQTNAPGTGLTDQWNTIEDAPNPFVIDIDQSEGVGSVFFRLIAQ